MVVTDLNGQLLETNALKPSSDLPTHLYSLSKNARNWSDCAHALPE